MDPSKLPMNWVIFDDPCYMDSFKLSVKEATSTTNVSKKQKVQGIPFRSSGRALQGPFRWWALIWTWRYTPPASHAFEGFSTMEIICEWEKRARKLIKKPWFRRPTNLNWWVYRSSGCHQQYVNPPQAGNERTIIKNIGKPLTNHTKVHLRPTPPAPCDLSSAGVSRRTQKIRTKTSPTNRT